MIFICNRYGIGPSLIPVKRVFDIRATGVVELTDFTGTPEDAEAYYNIFRKEAERSVPGLYLEDAVIIEAEEDFD